MACLDCRWTHCLLERVEGGAEIVRVISCTKERVDEEKEI